MSKIFDQLKKIKREQKATPSGDSDTSLVTLKEHLAPRPGKRPVPKRLIILGGTGIGLILIAVLTVLLFLPKPAARPMRPIVVSPPVQEVQAQEKAQPPETVSIETIEETPAEMEAAAPQGRLEITELPAIEIIEVPSEGPPAVAIEELPPLEIPPPEEAPIIVEVTPRPVEAPERPRVVTPEAPVEIVEKGPKELPPLIKVEGLERPEAPKIDIKVSEKPTAEPERPAVVARELPPAEAPQKVAEPERPKTVEAPEIKPPEIPTTPPVAEVKKIPEPEAPPAAAREPEGIPLPPARPDRAEKFRLAVFYQKSGDMKKALEQYTDLIKHDPMDAEAHNNLGSIRQELGDYEQAIQEYRKAILLRPNYYEARNNLGVALYRKGNLEGAMREFLAALEGNPRNVQSLTNLGVISKKSGDLHRAREFLEKALSINPSHVEAHYNLALILEDQGQVANAIYHYQKFLEFSGGRYASLTEEVMRHIQGLSQAGFR